MKTTFFPGQLLRVTRSIITSRVSDGDCTWIHEGELTTLVAILDRSQNKHNFITTVFLTRNGQVLAGTWAGEPFIMSNSQPCVEPVDTQ